MKKYYWLNEDSRTFLSRDYLPKGVSGEERVMQMAVNAENILGISGFAEKFENYMGNGFYSIATPTWNNFGNSKGLPCSCNGNYIKDDLSDILRNVAEVGMMSKYESGTSAFFGDLRPAGSIVSKGGTSSGPVHFMELFETVTNVVTQGATRRGNIAAYLPVDHSDIEKFLKIGDEGERIQNISIGVTISDEWMKSMIAGDPKKRKIQGLIIKKSFESGYPYIFFTDTVNNNAPQVYKDKGKKIHAGNLCNEICLSSDEHESFVCNLASMNLARYDDWKDTDAVETLIYFLDAVMSEYISKTGNLPFMEKAHRFAKNQRALGLGALGWHDLLQSKMLAFESMESKLLNIEIWKNIRSKTDMATEELAKLYGEPELLKGYGRRNVTTIAIAPTTSSSFILGQASPCIEPLDSNYFVKKLAKGAFTFKNRNLKKLLKEKSKNTDEVWHSILIRGGSVQHLEFLSEHEKNVFKTFGEISQKEVVIQAAQRQKYIDQGQSLNLMIPPDTAVKDVNALIIFAWENGVKGLYYRRSSNPAQQLMRNIMACPSCEG